MMLDWLQSIAGPDYARALLLTLLALVLLVIVLAVVKLVRSMTFGTFVSGGRNRKTRLAVMDATPVDSHRRLVLIRRDDTEHLLLIGGPTDVVVERDIRLVAPRRPIAGGEANQQQSTGQRTPLQDVPAPRRAAPVQQTIVPPPQAKTHERPAIASAASRLQPIPVRMPPLSAPAPRPTQAPREPIRETDDDTLIDDLDITLDDFANDQPAQPARKPAPTLEDEMTRLLGELSHKR